MANAFNNKDFIEELARTFQETAEEHLQEVQAYLDLAGVPEDKIEKAVTAVKQKLQEELKRAFNIQ